jgi:hypothetical protein
METFENTVTIHRPVDEVFAYLADFENIPTWNYAIKETSKISRGPVGVGAIYRQTRTVPRRSEEEFSVTAFDPDHELAIEGQIGPFRARASYVLEAVGDATRLVNRVAIEPSSVLLRPFAPLATSSVKSAVGRNLDKLKEILEGG